MKEQVQEILRSYGQRVLLRRGDEKHEVQAFLQPVTERNEREPDQMTPLGPVDGRKWLYLGAAEVQAGDRMVWNDMEFQVCSSRPFYMGEMLLYWWAALERAKEAVS